MPRLDRALFVSELNIGVSLWLLSLVVLEDRNSDDLTAASEVFSDRLLIRAKVDISDENTTLVRVVLSCRCRWLGTLSLTFFVFF